MFLHNGESNWIGCRPELSIKMVSQMESTIKLLMLEDTPEDAMLIQRTLKQSDLNLDIKHVSNEKDFTETIASFAPDIILSDHQLPQFTSTEALAICREKLPFCPFILVTGAV